MALLVATALPLAAQAQRALPPVTGIVWQLHDQAPDALGTWHKLGAHELLLQWIALDGVAYIAGSDLPQSRRTPDWQRIAREPWARRVIVGLSGRADEAVARRSLDAMLAESLAVAALSFPFPVSGWYFPAEADPSWKEAPAALPPVLARLPRPLWISAYDNRSIGPAEFADWLAGWLPRDVGVLFQDGVGVHVRTAPVAREYADALAKRLGKPRVRVIAEAFRSESGKFRAARAEEIRQQLSAYRGYPIYLFDGPHYVSEDLVSDLLAP